VAGWFRRKEERRRLLIIVIAASPHVKQKAIHRKDCLIPVPTC